MNLDLIGKAPSGYLLNQSGPDRARSCRKTTSHRTTGDPFFKTLPFPLRFSCLT
jgi:hypothetical protein